jgi:hypothetical protein
VRTMCNAHVVNVRLGGATTMPFRDIRGNRNRRAAGLESAYISDLGKDVVIR